MSTRLLSGRTIWPVTFLLLPLTGCGHASPAGPAPGPAPAAKAAEKPHVEGDLARTTLSAEAVRSLGVRSEAVKRQTVQQQLRLSGWVMVPQGREVTLTAPLAGYVLGPGDGEVPVAGKEVREGQLLCRIEPVLTPVEQIQMAALKRTMENEYAKARENASVAKSEVERTTELRRQRLRGQQELEQAQARLENAHEDLVAARDKLKLFGKPAGTAGELAPILIRAPRAGTVLSVPVSPGQYVTATAPLITVADMSRLWLRVPVPEADLPRLDRQANATVALKSGKPLSVKPVALVPLVDTARHTADIIYELPKKAQKRGLLAKDQMVTVGVPLDSAGKETMVPYDAVVFDAHAGAWIYVDKTPTGGAKTHIYERRRVELGPAVDTKVAVRPPCAEGERVVVVGAGVLFSREFYKPPKK